MPICYLCGNDGADTTEHVVPRCLYPGKLPSDVITLPAHAACNKLTSKDEEAFRNHISVAIPPGSPGFPLWQKTWKPIHRPEAAGMQPHLLHRHAQPPGARRRRGGSGLTDRGAAEERADRVLAKIVKGIFIWRTGEPLPGEAILWRFGQAENGAIRFACPTPSWSMMCSTFAEVAPRRAPRHHVDLGVPRSRLVLGLDDAQGEADARCRARGRVDDVARINVEPARGVPESAQRRSRTKRHGRGDGGAMTVKSFEELLAYGQEGEKTVGRWLASKRVQFLPLYQFKKVENAPFIWTADGMLTSPDFVCFLGDGRAEFVECKRRKWNTLGGPRVREVSVSPKHLGAYRLLAARTKCPVLVYFLTSDAPVGLYRANASDDLDLREWDGGGAYDEQLFIPFAKLEEVANAAEVGSLGASDKAT